MERRTLNRTIAGIVLGAVVLAGTVWLIRWRVEATRPLASQVQSAVRVVVPPGTRIRVEVINVSRRPGLARRATLYLRDAGFDVVRYESGAPYRDSTLVLDRSGHPEWARLLSSALGGAPVEPRPDSSRYLDLTVLLGASWAPPAQPLYP